MEPEDQWSCKRSPDYFPGITTTVKREKGATSIFRYSRAANSVVPDRICPNFELIQALMYVIVTCKYEKDLNKNSQKSGDIVFPIISPCFFSGVQGHLTPHSVVQSGRNSNSSELLYMPSLHASMKRNG